MNVCSAQRAACEQVADFCSRFILVHDAGTKIALAVLGGGVIGGVVAAASSSSPTPGTIQTNLHGHTWSIGYTPDTSADGFTATLAFTGPNGPIRASYGGGDRVYTNTVAGNVDATHFITPRLGLGGSASLNMMRYAQNALAKRPRPHGLGQCLLHPHHIVDYPHRNRVRMAGRTDPRLCRPYRAVQRKLYTRIWRWHYAGPRSVADPDCL